MNSSRHFLLAVLTFFSVALPALADVEKQADGSYLISGTWSFWSEKDILAPSGQTNLGDYKAVIFKPTVNEFEGVREMKQTPATFLVRARESSKGTGDVILVVEEILQKVE